MSKIEWTGETWNVVTGCTKIVAECKNCYAIPMSHRLARIEATAKKYEGVTTKTEGGRINFTGKVNFDEEALLKPLKRKTPTTYFVNSMSDIFHENISFDYIDKMFAVMALCPQHTFQILTKRADRMRKYFEQKFVDFNIGQEIAVLWYKNLAKTSQVCRPHLPFKNVWLGVSCGTQESAEKLVPDLLETPAKVRFLSCEPLLEEIIFKSQMDFECVGGYDPDYQITDLLKGYIEISKIDVKSEHDFSIYETGKIDWVIVGGESGKGGRPMHPDWVRSIRDQCAEAGVPFFFKQWGEYISLDDFKDRAGAFENKTLKAVNLFAECPMVKVGKKAAGRLLDGQEYNEMPNP